MDLGDGRMEGGWVWGCLLGDEYLPAMVVKNYWMMNDGYPITSC